MTHLQTLGTMFHLKYVQKDCFLFGRDPVLFCDGCYAVVSELQQDMVASKVTILFDIVIIVIIIIVIIFIIIIMMISSKTWWPVR